jgi:hypothetical protein
MGLSVYPINPLYSGIPSSRCTSNSTQVGNRQPRCLNYQTIIGTIIMLANELLTQGPPQLSIFQTLTFLKQYTGQEETQLVGQALLLGLQLLYRQTVEQAFIEETLPRNEAVNLLGAERVAELEYAKQALWQDIHQAFQLDINR